MDRRTSCSVGPCRRALIFVGLSLVLAGPGATRVRADAHGGRGADEGAQAQSVASAIAAKDYSGAYRTLVTWHKTRRSPQILYWLGKLESAQGHIVEAQDLMRRYLAESSDENRELSEGARRLLAAPRPPSAEVTLLGPTGALVFVDEKLVGALPLSAPLILAAGNRELAIELKQQRVADRVRITARRGAEVRFELSSGLVIVSPGPALLSIAELPADVIAAAALPAITTGIEEGAAQRRWAGLLPESLPLPAAQCAAELSCVRGAAGQQEVEHVLIIRGAADRKAAAVTLTMIDTVVGAPIAAKEVRCAGCAAAAWTAAVRGALPALLDEVTSRGRGTLQVKTTPPAAQLFLDDRPLGVAPLSRPYIGGSYELAAKLPGYKSARQPVTLRSGQSAELELTLEPGQDVAPPPRAPIRWRIAGAIGLGSAIFMLSIGATLVAIDGSCAPAWSSACTSLHDTRAGGGALIGIGLGLGIASGIVLGIKR